jgi:ADP-ribose pyrophosphatase YjhB (NUDIX family)
VFGFLAGIFRKHFPIVTVGGLLRDQEGNALLVRTRKWSGKWGIPGGKVEYGETLEAAFRREMREETGMEVSQCRLVLVQDCVEHPEFFRRRHFVLVNYVADTPGVKPAVRLNNEATDYLWTPLAEAEGVPLNGPTRVLIERVLRQGETVWTS